jgi:hypothetical protein
MYIYMCVCVCVCVCVYIYIYIIYVAAEKVAAREMTAGGGGMLVEERACSTSLEERASSTSLEERACSTSRALALSPAAPQLLPAPAPCLPNLAPNVAPTGTSLNRALIGLY